MQLLNSISLTSHVHNWLGNSCQPRLLHVFDQACNLINERREVLSIVTPQIGNGPFNLVVESDVLFPDFLDVETTILIQDRHLRLGELTITAANTTIWDPRPPWDVLHMHRADILFQLMQLRIPTDESLITQFSDFSKSLLPADLPSVLRLIPRIAGLGVGLTPSGDDFILGGIYAAWIIHAPETAGPFNHAIANTAAPLTTSLSAAWLESAGRGEAGILWHAFFDALISGQPVHIDQSVKNILAIGETSGADALAGFLSIFQLWKQEQA